ncbi:MAG TPA: hypothetical protein VLV83_11795, partial [Acidobacteriota bacterium]|nr:hypothetical protein [Acidobacteriota bacterium]
MSENCGNKQYGCVRLEWKCDQSAPACEVRIWWLGSLIVATKLNRTLQSVPFSAREEENDLKLSGELLFRSSPKGNSELLLDLNCPGEESKTYRIWHSGTSPLPPEPPVEPPEEEREVLIEEEDEGEYSLFPYIYLKPWPRISSSDRENRFVSYETVCVEPSDSLYCTLVSLDDRTAMEGEALAFIEGRAPFEDQFLGENPLYGPISELAVFDSQVRAHPRTNLKQFQTELEELLGLSWDAIEIYIRSDPEFAQELDRTWQNLFALTIVLGYDTHLLDGAVRTVVMARLLQRMVDEPGELWTTELIREGARATVILPATVFPLPPAQQGSPSPLPLSTIVPYAIGDLQIVRQRLKRYCLGEVSSIENVLKGESKETTRRNLKRTSESLNEEDVQGTENVHSLSGTKADLNSETERTLALDFKMDYETTYGPPTEGAEAAGYLEVLPNDDQEPQARWVEQAARFAKEVTSKTASRLARRVKLSRTSSTLDENETTVVNRFDATESPTNVIGIYRWVNKVYQAHVV